MNSHQIFLRKKNSLLLVVDSKLESAEPVDALVNKCDSLAWSLAHDPGKNNPAKTLMADAAIYKLNGKVEHFISKYYYLWPNEERFPTKDKRRKAKKPETTTE